MSQLRFFDTLGVRAWVVQKEGRTRRRSYNGRASRHSRLPSSLRPWGHSADLGRYESVGETIKKCERQSPPNIGAELSFIYFTNGGKAINLGPNLTVIRLENVG